MLGLNTPFIAVVKEFFQPLVLKALDHNQSVTFTVTSVNSRAAASHTVGHDEFFYVPFSRLGKKKDAAVVYPYQ